MHTENYNFATIPGPAGAPRQRRRRDWIWLFMLVPVVFVGGIGFGLWYVVRRVVVARSVSHNLSRELAGAKAEGLPLTPADLRPQPPVRESENAAPLYREITRLVTKDKADGDLFSNYLKGERDPAITTSVRGLLAKWAVPMQLAEGAARRPRCDFHRPWEQGPDVLFPELAQMRAVVRALSARAVMENADGRPLDSLSTVETAVRISHHAGEDPIVIGMLVEIALQAIADRAFREVVLAHLDDPSVQSRAREVDAAFDPPPNLERAFGGEVVMSRVCADIVRREPGRLDRSLGLKANRNLFRTTMSDAYEARLLEYWRSVFRVLRATKSDSLARFRRLSEIAQELNTHDGEPTYELCNILFPVFSEADAKALGSEARQRLREAIVALADYHRTRHRFPAEAEAITLLPPDPFTGRPLIYRREGNGFVLYSVGEDFRDDGGTDKPPKRGDPAPDIVVRCLAAN